MIISRALLAYSANVQERRSRERYELRLPAQISRLRGHRCSAVTLNISSMGVLFVAEGGALPELRLDDLFSIDIELGYELAEKI